MDSVRLCGEVGVWGCWATHFTILQRYEGAKTWHGGKQKRQEKLA